MEAQVPIYILAIIATTIVLLIATWLLIRLNRSRRANLSDWATSNLLNVDGIEIHYTQEGKGKDVILIHGIGASTYTWRLLIPYLARNFRVTVLDLPGFGRSTMNPKRDHGLDTQSAILIKFLDLLNIKKANLVGSSMGGAIALWLAKEFPERVESVVVLAPATHPKLLPLNVTFFSKVLLPSTNLLLTRTLFRQILKRVLSRHELINDEVVENYLRPYLQNGTAIQTFIRATSVLSDRRLPDQLRGIKTPVHILYGENDLMVPRSVIHELQKRLPHATLITHPTAGHHPHEDEPAWVASQIKQYFL
jgi:pimeloyl-ACP methyl ester carboxylesterase